ncbi:roadblock/LC7 domain-containing protein [Streptomyces actinomycinicus]|uniref:Roadblock/LC7 domain-containing protein n=1 Tax=Streptomyces actinomycinicus TaxID=1695166 RepID=A0A937ETD0_9ACTN|nr:roadblock/LC7 domain-containing protein [Streptomyces actinomycinicus]MBL1087569.1 roadblock/LC7 domain-containing protein [Streptomyces actinomycinicus]
MTAFEPQDVRPLDQCMNELVGLVKGIRHAVLISRDARLIAASSGLSGGDAENLASAAHGMRTVADELGRLSRAGAVLHAMVETEHAFLSLAAVPYGRSLAVISDAGADIGRIGYEMTLLVKRVAAPYEIPGQRISRDE